MTGDGNIGGVLDVVYLKDVIRRIYNYSDAECSETIGGLMCPVSFMPGSKPASELLHST